MTTTATTSTAPPRGGPTLTTEDVWAAIREASFSVFGHLTPSGEPRTSGVMHLAIGRTIWVTTSLDSWKSRHVRRDGRVSMTVLVPRGGLLAHVLPIPPATISFHGTATVHTGDSPEAEEVVERLGARLPEERRVSIAAIAVAPDGEFLTYGLGVPLLRMRDPTRSRAHVSVTEDA